MLALLLCLLLQVCVWAEKVFLLEPEVYAGKSPSPPDVTAIYFYRLACAECERVEDWLRALESGWPAVYVLRLDIAEPRAARLHEALCQRFKIPEGLRLVTPAVFTSRGALIGRDLTFQSLANLLATSAAVPLEMMDDRAERCFNAHAAILERFHRFALPTALFIGFWDGLNPCAFATMIFFVSYLRVGRRSRQTMWVTGLSFIVSVYLTYFLLGAGFLQFLARTNTQFRWGRFFEIAMGATAVVVGTRFLFEACRTVRGDVASVKSGLPKHVQQRIRAMLRGIFEVRGPILALTAFLTGAAVSLLELGCTGQTYLPTITYLIAVGVYRPRALALLAAYNAAFILPLLTLLSLGVYGMNAPRAHAWMNRHAQLTKSVTGFLAITVGALLIYRAIHF